MSERQLLEQKQIGFWACFYCANTHQFGKQECECRCHENEPPEHTAQNEEWDAWRRGEQRTAATKSKVEGVGFAAEIAKS